MGVSVSTNTSKQLTQSAIDVANTYKGACTGSIAAQTGITTNGQCQGIVAKDIDIESVSSLSVACMQSSTTSTSMKSAITSKVTQQALAAAQSLGLPSASVATSIQNAVTQLAEQVTTAYTSTCTAQVAAATGITCSAGTITADYIKITGTATNYNSCVQDQTSTVVAEQQFKQIFDLSSTAQEENSLNASVAVILIVLGAVAIFFVNSSSSIVGWIVVLIIFLIVVGIIFYAFLAQMNGWYPFVRKT